MNDVAIFWMQLSASLVVFGLVAVWYAWPALTRLPRKSALIALLFVHVPRYVGMTLLVTGMVDPKLPAEFLSSAAYGDLLEAALALACIFALRSNWRFAIPLVWVTNTWGFLDLLNGVRGVVQLNVPSFHLGTLWYIYTFYAPLVLVAHGMIFWLLLRSQRASANSSSPHGNS
ncbi:hypothetical protein [Thiomonas sp.]|jgi:hypothetical protein|uniref:hypothetical protein n=1 Tax=Thiomonas sp. TaxID=2047785 RepID=UPI0026040779|nr:hypothetical protein [Thiomonas sp.]